MKNQASTTDERILGIVDWGVRDYESSYARQREMVQERINGGKGDRLVIVEHPPTITIGRSGSDGDFLVPETVLHDNGIDVCKVDRGGKTTFHGPGQLVAYPIVRLRDNDLHIHVDSLLQAVEDVLKNFGLNPQRKSDQPGIWVNGSKICSIGIAVKKWVTYHGISINVNTDPSWFRFINPCGQPGATITSMSEELGRSIDLEDIKKPLIEAFSKRAGYSIKSMKPQGRSLPEWLLQHPMNADMAQGVEDELSDRQLNTVCNSAQCPNLGECFSKGTATFMILGTTCTRKCRFCAVDKGTPTPVDNTEPKRLAAAVKSMGLTYVVVTSVTRDDLIDGGAAHFSDTIAQIRKNCPGVAIEVLVPDFKSNKSSIDKVCGAQPDMFNHNLETVRRIYPSIDRPQNNYERSLSVLAHAAHKGLPVKSGLMLGLGETDKEIEEALTNLLEAGCRYLTLGQYLAPSKTHIPVARYVSPDEFNNWKKKALGLGFENVAAGPLVRSSYKAEEMAVVPVH